LNELLYVILELSAVILCAILVIAGIILAIVILKKKRGGKAQEPNYRALFIIGISFLPMGIIFITIIGPAFIGFTAMGLIFLIIGAANKDKWDK